MRKGQKKRIWTPEQKSEIVHKHIDEHISLGALSKAYSADKSMLCRWVKEFIRNVKSDLSSQKTFGQSFCSVIYQL